MDVAIIDYGAGNLRSVLRAFQYLGADCDIIDDPEQGRELRAIVFPGVGAAFSAMNELKRRGFDLYLKEKCAQGVPILGICLGTQIIFTKSEEGNTQCLGLIAGKVRRFPPNLRDDSNTRLKVPHMGWNSVEFVRAHPLCEGLSNGSEFYFVHSYYPEPEHREVIIGETEYGVVFPSIVGYRNIVAVQFHPEKSGKAGLKILENFLRWDGQC